VGADKERLKIPSNHGNELTRDKLLSTERNQGNQALLTNYISYDHPKKPSSPSNFTVRGGNKQLGAT
jgi:hypothetical protein